MEGQPRFLTAYHEEDLIDCLLTSSVPATSDVSRPLYKRYQPQFLTEFVLENLAQPGVAVESTNR
jgi:hypothetical protein